MNELMAYIHGHILTNPLFHVGSGIVYLIIVYLLFACRKKVFFTSDQPPELLHFIPTGRTSSGLGMSEVKTGLYIKNFPVFDVVKNNFVMDALIWFKFNPSLVRLEAIDKFTFDRCTNLVKSEPEILLEKDMLVVNYNIKLTFSNKLDYLFFPIDNHRLCIVMNNEYVTPNELIYSVQEDHFGCSNEVHTTDWHMVKKTVESGYSEIVLDPTKNQKASHPRVVYSIDLALAGLRKAALIFNPIILILLTGTFSLTLDIRSYSILIFSLSYGSVTGILAYRFVIEKISPDVGYFTMAELFYTIALFIGFITFVVNIIRTSADTDSTGILYLSILWYLSIKIIVIFTIFYLIYLWDPLKSKKMILIKKIKDTKSNILTNLLGRFNLDNLIKHSANMDEFPKSNNDNWNNPDYSTVNLSTRKHNFFKRLLSKITNYRYNKHSIFFPELFVGLLTNLLKKREPLSEDNKVLNIRPEKNSKFIIFGDIHGAFHSLIRDLEKLKSLDLIDDTLKINQPDCYLIFNGNVVGGSPYVIETLTVVLSLMLRNPDHVFYVRGPHENNKLQYSYQAYNELKIKTEHIFKNSTDVLANYLDQFFKTLPVAIYIEDDCHQLLRISHFKLDDEVDKFIDTADVKVMVQGLKRTITYQISSGLELLAPEKGISKWSILSCPTSSFKDLYNFTFDTFVILKTHGNIKRWIFDLYTQDAEKLPGYSEYLFNPVYAMKINDQAQINLFDYQHEIVIGTTLDLSKTSAVLGERMYQGLSLGISQTNSQGGIKNRPIRLVVLDDQYAPHIAKKNVTLLLEQYNTNLILSPIGTPTTETYLPLIKEKKLLVMFPYTGATIFRKKSLDHIIHLRTSYATEAKVLIQYATELMGIKRFIIFYQNDSYGTAALEGAREAFKRYNISDFVETPYQRNNPNIDACAAEVIKFNPSAILFFSTHAPSRALIQKLGVNRLVDIKLFGISFLTDVFRIFLNTIGLQLIISRVMPDLDGSNLPIVAEYRSAIEQNFFGGVVSEDSFEGYINASFLTTILDSIKPPYTKEKLIAEFEAIQNYNFKGMKLNFDPLTRELYKEVWIDTGKKAIILPPIDLDRDFR